MVQNGGGKEEGRKRKNKEMKKVALLLSVDTDSVTTDAIYMFHYLRIHSTLQIHRRNTNRPVFSKSLQSKIGSEKTTEGVKKECGQT